MLNHKKYRSILCLNGDLPDKSFFSTSMPVIAADGAANQLAAMGVMPDIIIGDLDSVDKSLLNSCAHLHDSDQDKSDFQKCLSHMQKNDLLPAIITGVDGGCLDHVLNNINLFSQTECLIAASSMTGFVLRNGSKSFSVEPGTKISLLGLPHAVVTTTGLKWELDKSTLTFPGMNSCFNRASDGEVRIEVQEGSVLVLVYSLMVVDAGW